MDLHAAPITVSSLDLQRLEALLEGADARAADGADALRAKTSAMARRTSGDGSSSCINRPPSAAARSSSERSEMSQARARARVASARSPAGAVRTQLMNCRTIMVFPAYATCNDTETRCHCHEK